MVTLKSTTAQEPAYWRLKTSFPETGVLRYCCYAANLTFGAVSLTILDKIYLVHVSGCVQVLLMVSPKWFVMSVYFP